MTLAEESSAEAPSETPAYSYDDDAAAIDDFFERGFTDGLPVIPPTPERVAAMLGGFAPDLILGEVPTRNVEVTAEKTAINAVMAGCLPEYFPTVVATVRAFLQPKANAHSTTATFAGAAHAVIINGPVRARDRRRMRSGVLRPRVPRQRHHRPRAATRDPQRVPDGAGRARPGHVELAAAVLVLLR